MTEKWIGKVGVVTGASSGIGATIFKDLAKAGITVVGLARRSERIEAIIAALGEAKGNAFAFKCDVTNSESVAEVFKWIEGKFGAVHILINNAGITRNGNILDGAESSKTLNDVIDTNLRGVMQCTSEAYRLMKKSNDYGMIINVNSILGHHIPFMGFSFNVYPASKFAVTALTESIRHELILADNKKVRVTSLSPGRVRTEIASRLQDPDTSEILENPLAAAPSLAVEDISHSVMFLLSTPYNVNISELTIRPVGDKM